MESGSGYVRKRLGSSPAQSPGEPPGAAGKAKQEPPAAGQRPGQIPKTKINIGQIPDDKQDERERIRRYLWGKCHLYGGGRRREQQFWL